MLLLYQGCLSRTEDPLSNLHSTMLLLYRFWTSCGMSRIKYLHSTMLLLYRGTTFNNPPTISIYIPLCFYFIERNSGRWMLRSLQDQNPLIYIPLCFYFIRMCTAWLIFPDRIYIPLCFYFIVNVRQTPGGTVIFTFHYASTLSEHSVCVCIRGSSIYIPLCFYFIGRRGIYRSL